MKFEYRFPDIGEGITEGVLFKWFVKEGDPIKEGDPVAEVETDKVTADIPSARTGTVEKLNFKIGDTINVGDVFIVIDTDNNAASPNENLKEESNKTDEAGQTEKVDQTQDGQTDEVSQEKIPEGTKAKVFADSKQAKKRELDEKEEVLEEETAGVVGEVIASSREIPPSTEGQDSIHPATQQKKALATPVARQMAKDLGVDIRSVSGTGPNGRVMKEDINKAAQPKAETGKAIAPADSPSDNKGDFATDSSLHNSGHGSAEAEERIPLTSIRKTIAARMSQSRFTIPHTTAMDEIDITALDEFRKKYKEVLQDEGISLTYLPFIVKAVILALKEHPEFNSELDEAKSEVILKHYYHIGIATDTDRGLMVPVVRDADKMSTIDLAQAIERVTVRAKDNKVALTDLKGSTFSVTNYGSIGGYFGIPIINHPEAAVLGLGRITKKPVVIGDEIVIRKVLPLSLSYDHRIIDGASGARFLNTLRDLLADPELLLLKS